MACRALLTGLVVVSTTSPVHADFPILCKKLTRVDHSMFYEPKQTQAPSILFAAVHFRKGTVPAETAKVVTTPYQAHVPLSYQFGAGVTDGSCTWLDRGMHANEPAVLQIADRTWGQFPTWHNLEVKVDDRGQSTTRVRSGIADVFASSFLALNVSNAGAALKVTRALKIAPRIECTGKLHKYSSATWAECITSCLNDNQCKSFTWRTTGTDDGGRLTVVGSCRAYEIDGDAHCKLDRANTPITWAWSGHSTKPSATPPHNPW